MILVDNENSVGKWISVLYRYRKSYVNRKLEPYGIGGCQYLFLITLFKFDGASQEKISDYLKIDKTTTAKEVVSMFVKKQRTNETAENYRLLIDFPDGSK